MNRLKNSKDITEYRNQLIKEQNNIDPIILEEIKAPCLDHCHITGVVRQVLDREVNCLLGKIENAFRRYLGHKTKKPLVDVLENVIKYLKQDYTQNPLHPTSVKVELRPFRRLKAQKQIKILESLNQNPKSTLKGRVQQIRKLIIKNVISSGTLKNLCKEA